MIVYSLFAIARRLRKMAITCLVTDLRGVPLAGIDVALRCHAEGKHRFHAKTNSHGMISTWVPKERTTGLGEGRISPASGTL